MSGRNTSAAASTLRAASTWITTRSRFVEVTREPTGETVRQQAERLTRRRAVVARDARARRRLPGIRPMPGEPAPAPRMAGTPRETCVRPGALGNISLAGQRSLVTQLHRPAHATVAAATGTASLPRRCSSRRRGRVLPHLALGAHRTLRPAIRRFLTGRIRAMWSGGLRDYVRANSVLPDVAVVRGPEPTVDDVDGLVTAFCEPARQRWRELCVDQEPHQAIRRTAWSAWAAAYSSAATISSGSR